MPGENEMQLDCLYHGDNLAVLHEHVRTGSIDMIYIDPPFNANRVFISSTSDTGAGSFDDTWTWSADATKALADITSNYPGLSMAMQGFAMILGESSLLAYLVMMAPRIADLHRVLKATGSFYLHCDGHADAYLRVLCDVIFQKEPNTVIRWIRSLPKGNAKNMAKNSDTILFYNKGTRFTWHQQYLPVSPDYAMSFDLDDHDGRGPYVSDPTVAPPPGGHRYDLGFGEKMPRHGYRWTEETMRRMLADNRVIIAPGKVPRYKRYLSELKGRPLDDTWTGILFTAGNESTGYPTQKPEALLERIICLSSNPGDVILDAFCGSGTTCAVAKRLGRRWIGIDVARAAIDIASARIDGISVPVTF